MKCRGGLARSSMLNEMEMNHDVRPLSLLLHDKLCHCKFKTEGQTAIETHTMCTEKLTLRLTQRGRKHNKLQALVVFWVAVLYSIFAVCQRYGGT
jgi:hypothetical protein